jgi:short-subunit dehydrogenase
MTEVNYLAPAELSRQVIPGMLDRGRGHIVNISSMAGSLVFPGLAAYSGSKAALAHFTAGLRADLRGLPIGTTLVELGIVPTEQARDTGDYAPTRAAAGRFCQTRLLDIVSREEVAREVVAAVRKDRRHLRLPKRGAVVSTFVEAPRRASEFLLTGIAHRPAPLPPDGPKPKS